MTRFELLTELRGYCTVVEYQLHAGKMTYELRTLVEYGRTYYHKPVTA